MHRGAAVAALALCLVTAGCTGLVGSGSPSAGETVTPAPVPAQPPAPVAPGLTEAGVTDTRALARAHVTTLGNVSYTLRHTRTVQTANGTVRLRQVTTGEFAANYRTYVATRTITGTEVPPTEIRTRWAEGRAVQWTTVNGTTRREIVADGRGIGAPPLPPRAALFFDPTYNGRVAALFAGANVTAVTRTSEEVMQTYRAPVSRVVADGAADRSQFPVVHAERVGDVRFTAVVGPSGVVYGYGTQYTVVRNGTTLHVTESLRYSDLGTTTPRRGPASSPE
ncbi:hypothetical protein EGH21_04790 [Halomicroarcula sp. F13]|uniref:DUF2092 domain-containing protein n=1 Tax=Haloarcula rubra TaxID=2487747 RepID=A0AAW4PMH6_9EURY|nr:hypothetical protein [Halomicroarcula rubra]MBX0322346.1 hypothetical protein [Halomicroarcula rubra]